ncbi:hypothetical protein ACFLQ2_03030 [archaeon]
MKTSVKAGVTFGLTSGIITTLGLMVGLHSGTHSQIVVLGGILTIAVADAMSDALGMHVSTEAEGHKSREVWEATLSTFAAKLFFALTFLVPVLLLELYTAIVASIVWGLSALAVLSYFIAKQDGTSPTRVVGEHLAIAVVVIVVTHFVGEWVATLM